MDSNRERPFVPGLDSMPSANTKPRLAGAWAHREGMASAVAFRLRLGQCDGFPYGSKEGRNSKKAWSRVSQALAKWALKDFG